MTNYRKLYEQHFGPIPKDACGRSLEIHHRDGNHNNNSLDNLQLVTIDEHYQIHFNQGDYGACLIMSHRMRLSPEQKSLLAKQCQNRIVNEGRHHWQGPAHNRDLVARGIHPFLDRNAARDRNLRRILEGTHNLLGDSNPVHKLIATGQHHFQTRNPSKLKIQNGTHHFLSCHPNKVQVTCPHCNKSGGAVNMKRYHFDNCKALKV